MNELNVILATIYGEAATSSPAAWGGILSVIFNRVNVREWKDAETPLEVIQETGFDAYSQTNAPFLRAIRLLEAGVIPKGTALARLVEAVTPLYLAGKAPIPGIILYYSPKAQALLHNARPGLYRAAPPWNWNVIEEVRVPGAEADDFRFYKYKGAPVKHRIDIAKGEA